MATRRSNKRNDQLPSETNNLAGVLESVRSIWAAAENAEPAMRTWVIKKITDDIARLKQQVQGKLRLASFALPQQQTLFRPEDERPKHDPKPKMVKSPAPDAPEKPRFSEPAMRVYAKDLAAQALQQLPNIGHCNSIAELRKYLPIEMRGTKCQKKPTNPIKKHLGN